MKPGCPSAVGLFLALTALTVAAEPEKFIIDPTHTFPTFEISHLGFSKHRGRFNTTRGTIMLDRIKKQGEIDVVIDATSIDTGQEALEKVLRGEGFFEVEKYPELRFTSLTFNFEGDRPTAVHGTLNMKGREQPLSLTIDHFHCGHRLFEARLVCGANAVGRLQRSEFGIDKYVSFGLGDEVKISIQIEALAEKIEPPLSN